MVAHASEVQGHPWVHNEFEAMLSIMRSCVQKDKNSNESLFHFKKVSEYLQHLKKVSGCLQYT